MNSGSVRAIRDLVVEVQFDGDMPDSGEILVTNSQRHGILLVDHLADNKMAVCLNVMADRSLEKNMTAERTGHGLEIPVGPAAIGRIFDALGHPLDGQALPAKGLKQRNIMHIPPRVSSFRAVRNDL